MKVPAVAIAAAFACGIAFGLWAPVARESTSRFIVAGGLFLILALFVAAGVFVSRNWLTPAAALSGLCWTLLGVVAAVIAEQPLPANHITSLIESTRVDLHNPLRWHGRLRDEPQKLPWGYGLEIELAGVEYRGSLLPTRGGLRMTYSRRPNDPPLPDLHAGDDIAVLAQAKRPQVFKDEGAFDRRGYLASQDIDLLASLRAPELIERASSSGRSASVLVAKGRRKLRDELDALFSAQPQVAAVLRAMLLGDRSFVDREESADFQKTGVFHVLVIAGLHVGALAAFLLWLGRKLRLSPGSNVFFTLTLLLVYVAVVEQRAPVLRAALMAGIIVIGRLFYRRLELLNSAGLAALILLIAKPMALRDSSFQLTFVAMGCIGGLALPWLDHTVQPYAKALRGWRDVTRDAAHPPHAAQFRMDLRSAARSIASRLPRRLVTPAENAVVSGLGLSFRLWELFVLTVVLQIGMLPLMARDFHRITLAAPIVNLLAVPLTGLIVPLGFLALASSLAAPAIGRILSLPLSWTTLLLVRVVKWFAGFPHWSYRIPSPQLWLMTTFFALAALLCVTIRISFAWKRRTVIGLCGGLVLCSLPIALFPFKPQWLPGKLEVSVLDVGQGDALFVVSPGGRTLLIDGGGAFGGFLGEKQSVGIDPGEEAVSPYLWSRGLQKLDAVALTHAHQDHIGGLAAVLENFKVGELWIGKEVLSPALARLERLAHAHRIGIKHLGRGQRFSWDGVEGQFFWPESSSPESASAPKNDDSLVIALRYGTRIMLLPGDAEKEAERGILGENPATALQADILKVGHHGSKNSSTPDFLSAVHPTWAIISAGEDNPYGHPHPELLGRLEAAHIHILRTDRDGAVHILTDGNQVEISCFVSCRNAMEPLRQAQTPNQEEKSHQ